MSTSSNLSAFTPKDLEAVSLDKTTIFLYPRITSDMEDAEKQYGLLVNKAALENSTIPIKTKLSALGQRTETSTIIGITQAQVIDHAQRFILTSKNFTVVSYHRATGKVIQNCLKTDNSGTLKSYSNQSTANRRPADVLYAKLSTDISFAAIDSTAVTIHPFTFYIRLQQETRTVQDNNGNDVILTTFFGPDDWVTRGDQTIIDQVIMHPQRIEKPFDLEEPAISSDKIAAAVIKIETAWTRLENISLLACWNIICKRVFAQVCPDMQSDPVTVIQECHQIGTKSDGEKYELSVEQYFQSLNRLLDFLPKIGTWPLDVVQNFISHSKKEIREELNSPKSSFRYNPVTASKAPHEQMINLQKAYSAALAIEKSQNNMKLIAQNELKSSHAFMATAHFSLADKAMKENGKKLEKICWGCKSTEHQYTDRSGKVICPKASDPSVMAEAAKCREEYNKKRRARRNNSDKKLRAQLARVLGSNVTTDGNSGGSESPTKKSKNDHLILMMLLCMNAKMNAKPVLPISFNINLPHILLDIGDSSSLNLKLSCGYDTLAVLNVGNADFHLRLAKRYPHLVKSLVFAKDEYSPLTLSGVVGKGDDYKPTAALPAVIEYHLSYKTKHGDSASFKIALGKQVAVNTIIGFAMIKTGKLSLDLENDVVTSSVLAFPEPLKVTYKPVQVTPIPDFSGFPPSTSNSQTSLVSIQAIMSCFQLCCEANVEETKEDKADTSKDTKDDKKGGKYVRSLIQIPKPKWRPKTKNEWNNEPRDHEEGYEIVESCYGKNFYLRKNIQQFQFPKPNPDFDYKYNEDVDRAELDEHLILDSDISTDNTNRIREFVKKYWDVFREEGIKIPIQSYEMVVDTGDHKPVKVPLPRYGLFEAPIMQRTIDRLLDFGHIKLDNTSPWGFRITLAPKPHQEDCDNIEEYIWRFCINYIQLNRITRPSEYPIPRCDDAVMYGFGNATFFILLDAFSGYHQIRLSAASIAKTAFYAPYGRKYVWLVMPFGLTNAPAIFISMMHDLKALWVLLCEKYGINPSEHEGSTIIMDDCFLFALTINNIFIIVECVCIIARKYNLTWKLKKCRWLPSEVEFVGVDVSVQGNSPASSKFERLKLWKIPQTPRDIMSFIGFAIFYLRWISHFEQRIKPLRQLLTQFKADHKFTNTEFTSVHEKVFKDIHDFILSKPILRRANVNKRFYLKTDFSKVGLGWALCQPDDSPESIKAMEDEDNGGPCLFDCTLKGPRLFPIAFGGRKTIGNEEHFHSHPGESLSASYGITKNRHFLWGRPFTLMSDCNALKWIMSYEGTNHAVRRLQLELYGYWFTIVNRPGYMMEDANYFSRLGENIHIDPLLKDYLTIARQMRSKYSPDTGEINQSNLPGRRKKKVQFQLENNTMTDEPHFTVSFASLSFPDTNPIIEHEEDFSTCFLASFQNIPTVIEHSNTYHHVNNNYSSYVTKSANTLKSYKWCLYKPQAGHMIQCCNLNHIPFECTLVIEPSQSCRNFLQHNFHIPTIKDTTHSAINHILNTDNEIIKGYYATFTTTDIESSRDEQWFLKKQLELIHTLHTKSHTHIFCIELHEPFKKDLFNKFTDKLLDNGWYILRQHMEYLRQSDKLAKLVTIYLGFHNSYFTEDQFEHIPQPPMQPVDINCHINIFLNKFDYSIPHITTLFDLEKKDKTEERKPRLLAVLKPKNQDDTTELGYQIYSTDTAVPIPSTNQGGLFGQLFGITFKEHSAGDTYCRSISVFEYSSCFLYDNSYTVEISKINNILNILRNTTPYRTQYSILFKLFECLDRRRNKEIQLNSDYTYMNFQPSAFLNGITPHQLPNEYAWDQAYSQDQDCALMKKMIENPSLIDEKNLKKIHFIYRSPLRKSQIVWTQNRLIFNEPIAASHKTARLIIVPEKLRHHIFTAFHANPIGGHLGAYQTFHRIRLRYFWPHMWTFIKELITRCAGCLMKKVGKAGSELSYSFPLDAPFMSICGDLYSPGKVCSFDGATSLMIILDYLTGFAAIEPLGDNINSKQFAKTCYSIMLRYGLPHLFISDPDSKFHGEFKQMCKLLKIKHHTSAKGNHNAILVERFNRFLNEGLRVFNNDRNSNMVFLEGAQLLTYAWNSAPVIGTDLSRSLIAVGREFHFPIDYTSRQHQTIIIDESKVKSFADDMLQLLEKSREIYTILIQEHRAYHREYRNAQLHNPKKFKVGDIVFTNVQVQSNKARGIVGKLSYIKRGPYKITKSYASGSYELDPMTGSPTIKKHGSDLFLSPPEIIPVQSISESSDRIYSELNKKVVDNPFEVIKIKGYEKAQPWAAPAASSQIESPEHHIPPFPTVEDLDNEFDSWPDENPFYPSVEIVEDSKRSSVDISKVCPDQANIQCEEDNQISAFTANTKPLSDVIASIIQSHDKLMFISYQLPNEKRREWKLVQIDLKNSLSKRPSCLQDGIFFAIFYIQHPHDESHHISDRRFWLEYHRRTNLKTISSNYHLIQPSETSHTTAANKGLIPYSDWIDLTSNALIHGPFDFATVNNRKTRDRISEADWTILASKNNSYDNDAPDLKQSQRIHINWSQPIFLKHLQSQEVSTRVHSFITHLSHRDEDLNTYTFGK